MEEQVQKDNQPVAEVKDEPKPRKPSRRQNWLFGTGISLVLILIGLICLGKGRLEFSSNPIGIRYWPEVPQELNVWKFDGPSGQAPATVPFTNKNGLMYVQGSINSTPVNFLVDTGASDSDLPANLQVGGRQYMDDGYTVDGAGNSATSHPYLFDQATIGSCVIHNFTASVNQSPILKGAHARLLPMDVTLGNTALSQIALTIDYKKRVLVLSPSRFHSSAESSKRRDCYQLCWQSRDSEASSNGPVIYGRCGGHLLTILVDTGATGTAISPQLASDIQRSNPTRFRLMHGSANSVTTFGIQRMDMLNRFDFTLDCPPRNKYVLNGSAVIEAGLIGNSKVVLGASALSKHIITIDYPQRTIALSPHT